MDVDEEMCGRLPGTQYVELAVEICTLLADAISHVEHTLDPGARRRHHA